MYIYIMFSPEKCSVVRSPLITDRKTVSHIAHYHRPCRSGRQVRQVAKSKQSH